MNVMGTKRNNSLSEAELKRLFVEQGLSVEEISKRHGAPSINTIYRRLDMWNIRPRNPAGKVGIISKRPPKEELKKLYFEKNHTQSQIAEIYGVSFQSVSKWMQDLEIKADTRLKHRPQWNRKNAPSKEELSRLYEQDGHTLDEIGERYRTDRNMIRRWMGERGISIKTIYEEYNGYFENIDTPEKAYWLGFIQGDGSVGIYTLTAPPQRTIYKLTIGLERKDSEHLHLINDAMGYSTCPISHRTTTFTIKGGNIPRPHSKSHLSVRVWTSRRLVKDLISHGIEQRKSFKDVDIDLPKGLELPFLCGLLDSDGSVGITKIHSGSLDAQIAFLGSHKLISKVRKFLGVTAKIYYRSEHLAQITIGGRWQAEEILDSLYGSSPIHLERKYQKYLEIKIYNTKFPRGTGKGTFGGKPFSPKNPAVPKIHIDKDALHKRYIEEDNSLDETAKHFGVSKPTVVRRLREFKIRKNRRRNSPVNASVRNTKGVE
jgi:transposase